MCIIYNFDTQMGPTNDSKTYLGIKNMHSAVAKIKN